MPSFCLWSPPLPSQTSPTVNPSAFTPNLVYQCNHSQVPTATQRRWWVNKVEIAPEDGSQPTATFNHNSWIDADADAEGSVTLTKFMPATDYRFVLHTGEPTGAETAALVEAGRGRACVREGAGC